MPYIEIKTCRKLGLTAIRKIIDKNCVSGILTTGEITTEAKKFLDAHDVAYAENIPEGEVLE